MRFNPKSILDWIAVAVFMVGVWIAIYTTILRHP